MHLPKNCNIYLRLNNKHKRMTFIGGDKRTKIKFKRHNEEKMSYVEKENGNPNSSDYCECYSYSKHVLVIFFNTLCISLVQCELL